MNEKLECLKLAVELCNNKPMTPESILDMADKFYYYVKSDKVKDNFADGKTLEKSKTRPSNRRTSKK